MDSWGQCVDSVKSLTKSIKIQEKEAENARENTTARAKAGDECLLRSRRRSATTRFVTRVWRNENLYRNEITIGFVNIYTEHVLSGGGSAGGVPTARSVRRAAAALDKTIHILRVTQRELGPLRRWHRFHFCAPRTDTLRGRGEPRGPDCSQLLSRSAVLTPTIYDTSTMYCTVTVSSSPHSTWRIHTWFHISHF